MVYETVPSRVEANTPSCCTFAVSDVTPATVPLTEFDYREAITKFLGGPVEACSKGVERLVATCGAHPLIETLHKAFCWHHPVRLTPDVIWLTLMQGVALHINENSESLRRQFVAHDGKAEIRVVRNTFFKGSPNNDWPGVFPEFSDQIRTHIGPTLDWMLADFSTTTPVARAASEITLLDAMQSYFSYTLITLCGIPCITLEGTPDDWRRIAQRMHGFSRFDLAWWVDALAPILDQFVAAREGRVDRAFWESIYKFKGPRGSGGHPSVSGWAARLFPYLQSTRGTKYRNPVLGSPELIASGGPEPTAIPAFPAKTPFNWKYFATELPMEFIGGLLGIRQDPDTFCLTPEIGWAVRDATSNPVERCSSRGDDIEMSFARSFAVSRRRFT